MGNRIRRGDPLSFREMQIAHARIAGSTAQETADMFGITLATVKAHTHHIYIKLGVDSVAHLIQHFKTLNDRVLITVAIGELNNRIETIGNERSGRQLISQSLTDRERQIASHRAHGLTNKETAVALHITINTVKNTMARVYKKLQVDNVPDLINALRGEVKHQRHNGVLAKLGEEKRQALEERGLIGTYIYAHEDGQLDTLKWITGLLEGLVRDVPQP